MLALASTLLFAAAALAQSTASYPEGVVATGTMGTSLARLLTINSVDDWCIFGPPTEQNISDSETFEVAWCTQPRNNARVIPDGTVTGVSLLKTDMYVQIMAYGNFTNVNIPPGDYGGELDPHGATGAGNPVGGNVTTNMTIDGQSINVAEWMLYIDYEMVCFRACTWANETYSSAAMCWHELDEMGCNFVMPGNYDFNGTFETCEADVAYPPGWYVEGVNEGTTSFSSFAQYWTGEVSGVTYTIGDLVTPSTVQFIPSSSSCVTVPTISNGIALASLGITDAAAATGAPGASGTGTAAGAGATGAPGSSGSSGSGNSNAAVSGARVFTGLTEAIALVSTIAGVAAIGLLH
ncbi:hypothetical protein BDP27DRAFT_1390654 [Rhodocollybia butyracea]|uniref:Uncharacterized protein n=1 Tax=Rhodocollybia butyracea TaxID=206335 RepID=A0A9P5Q2Z4_9AGAR|nr:hypothetical protein BDP27DRAFT_1390654 [Rhodocollybia butyracea]